MRSLTIALLAVAAPLFVGCAAPTEGPDETENTENTAEAVTSTIGNEVRRESWHFNDTSLTRTGEFDRNNLFLADEGTYAHRYPNDGVQLNAPKRSLSGTVPGVATDDPSKARQAAE